MGPTKNDISKGKKSTLRKSHYIKMFSILFGLFEDIPFFVKMLQESRAGRTLYHGTMP